MKPTGPAAPPLAKGLACQRCSARKVRCTGGKPACNACLRTAKFKNHPLDQVVCAYGTGLCTEHTPEKGPGGHGGRGRKLKEQQQQQQQQQQQGGSIPVVVSQPQDRRGLGPRTYTQDSYASFATGQSPQSAASSEPSYTFDISTNNSPNFTPATSIGSLSPGFGKLDPSSIVAALNLPQPPPHPQPPILNKAKVPLATRRQGLAPMKIELPTTWSGPSTAGVKRPAPADEQPQPKSAKLPMNQGSLLERRRGSVMPDMVIPLAKRSRSNSPTQAISPVHHRAQSINGQSQADALAQPALSYSGETSNGSSIASGIQVPSFADSPLVDTPVFQHSQQQHHHHHQQPAQPQSFETMPTPDPYPSSFGSYLNGWSDAFSSFSTPLVNLMTGGGRLTAGLGVGTPFWYGEKKTAGLAELDFGLDAPAAGGAESARVGETEITWGRV